MKGADQCGICINSAHVAKVLHDFLRTNKNATSHASDHYENQEVPAPAASTSRESSENQAQQDLLAEAPAAAPLPERSYRSKHEYRHKHDYRHKHAKLLTAVPAPAPVPARSNLFRHAKRVGVAPAAAPLEEQSYRFIHAELADVAVQTSGNPKFLLRLTTLKTSI